MKRSGFQRGKPNKFRAVRCASMLPEYNGYIFDSGVEKRRAEHLALLARAGEIQELQVHKTLDLRILGHHITNYKPDFIYIESGKTIVEDVKGICDRRFMMIKRMWPLIPHGTLRIVKDGGRSGWIKEEVRGSQE